MARSATVIRQVRDFDGIEWDVRESRTTTHGFDILLGWPPGCRGSGGGGPRLIPTSDLVAYFERFRLNRDGSIYDLPVARSTVKRIRRVLGLNYYEQNEAWWLERIKDLIEMPGVRFAAVHGVSPEMVSVMHTRLLGRRIRVPGWWRETKAAEMLAGELPRSYVAEKLDISIGAVGRLRWILRKESR